MSLSATITVKQTLDNAAAIRRAVDYMARHRVLVGIPEDKSARPDGAGASNALIGYVQEHGSPKQNIPARPFLQPGINDAQPEVIPLLKAASEQAMQGQKGRVEAIFNKIGTIAVNRVRAKFVENDWTPLDEKTLAARAHEEGKKKGQPPSKQNPLLDSKQLRNAIASDVRKVS